VESTPPVAKTLGLVLVVDDDPDILDLLADALGTQGYDVLTAIGGDALPLARDRQPSLILLDLMMPGMDGLEVSKRLRADPLTAHIPIVAMSAQEHLMETARRMLVDDHLAKPFHLRSLYTTVAHWSRSA
jgi:CheY-like chemotaxis protein